MQTIRSYIKDYFEENKNSLGLDYPGLRFERLLEEFIYYTGVNQDQMFLGEGKAFFKLVSDGMPFEYIQNNSYFYKTNFYVDHHVLIPRSETEILVEDTICAIKKCSSERPSICEIGTGSFALGLSVLCELDKPVDFWGGDISTDAIEVSKLNHFRLTSKIHPETNVTLWLNDKLKNISEKFDIIVSNPPYIKEEEDRDGVHTQAHHYEPHLALYLKDSEFESWFRELFEQSSNCLKEGGIFLMEGHEDSLSDLEVIAKEYFSEVKIKKDYTQRDRFLHGKL